MKKYIFLSFTVAVLLFSVSYSQKTMQVPQAVKTAFQQKFPDATNVHWEKEKGNFEGNWGGKSNEDNSAVFTPAGNFLEIAKAIPVAQLPGEALNYIKMHYKGTVISEAAIVTNAKGRITYEAEVNKKDVVFDDKGKFLKTEKE